MIGIVVAGHGRFASGISSLLELVVGKQENFEFVDFGEGESQNDLEEKFNEKLEILESCDNIVIMTDITGGSPFKAAVMFALSDDRIHVISGTNVPMLVELIFGRINFNDFQTLIETAMEAGRQQITQFYKGMI